MRAHEGDPGFPAAEPTNSETHYCGFCHERKDLLAPAAIDTGRPRWTRIRIPKPGGWRDGYYCPTCLPEVKRRLMAGEYRGGAADPFDAPARAAKSDPVPDV